MYVCTNGFMCVYSRDCICECDSKRSELSLIGIGFNMASLQDEITHEFCVGSIYILHFSQNKMLLLAVTMLLLCVHIERGVIETRENLEGKALQIIPFEIVFTISRPYLTKRFQTVNTNLEIKRYWSVFENVLKGEKLSLPLKFEGLA